MSEKLNYLFFFPDEMRASSVGCYGNKHVSMPNYDKVANEGVLFENCIVQNPVCSPSRCSLMTGRYVHNDGHRTLWHLLRPHENSLFKYLKKSGYDIAWFGKNDLYSQDELEKICEDLDEKRNGYKNKPSLKGGMSHSGKNSYDLNDDMYYSFLYEPLKTQDDAIPIDYDVARALDFLDGRTQDSNPFMLYLPLNMPHPPYDCIEKFYNMYDTADLSDDLKPPYDAENEPLFAKLIREYRKTNKWDKQAFAKIYSVYLGMNSYMDYMLGLLLESLEKSGLAENTVIILSSDHGDWAGDYELVEKWPNAMDDDIVKVPLIIKTPDCIKAKRVTGQVELFDIMPTVLDLTGIDAEHTHFAKTLIPHLNTDYDDLSRPAFCEGGYDEFEPRSSEGYERDAIHNNPKFIYYPKAKQQKDYPKSVCRTTMMRTLKHKLVIRTSLQNEFYDLEKDQNELNNLYNNSNYKDIIAQMEKEMLMWYIKTSDTAPFDEDIRTY